MRVIFAGGGTGGHLYPGLAIARAMVALSPEVKPFFIGARRGIERTVLPTTEFPHELLDLHPLYRSKPWENWKTLRGAISAWSRIGKIVHEERPACVVGTGGYASGLVLAYATVHKIPIAIQEQNSYPGITTKFFSRYASQIHNGFPEAVEYLHPGKNTVVFDSGNPIEPPPERHPDKNLARAQWKFTHEGPVLLVYGGSQGSKAINDVIADWIKLGLPEGMNMIWATGQATYDDYAKFESPTVRVRPYVSPMSDAYAAADFAIARGGAMATAELAAWGIPPIVIPLPTAAADHQTTNAQALTAAGTAEMIVQKDLRAFVLDLSVRNLLKEPQKLAERSSLAQKRARPNAARDIAGHILELARQN